MKDRKQKGTARLTYLGVIVILGVIAVGLSLHRLATGEVSYQWMILAYLTILTGTFTIAIPRANSKLSVSDTFIFINTILFGTAAGVLTAALDGLVGSLRCRTKAQRKWTLPFNTAVMAVSAFAAGEMFFRIFEDGPLSQATVIQFPTFILSILLWALIYFLCNSATAAIMVALANGGSAFGIWRTAYLKTFMLFAISAAAGGIVSFAIRSITPLALLAVISVLVAIYILERLYVGPGEARIDQAPAHRRFHYFMVALGVVFITLLIQDAFGILNSYQWIILAVLAVLGGFITVKIPGIKIKFSLADTFVFANIILFGPIVGAITAAIDGFAGSMRCKTKSRRVEFMLFNVAATAIPAYIAGELFVRTLIRQPVSQNPGMISPAAFFPVILLAISYYVINSTCVAIIVALQNNQRIIRVWRENLLWGLIPPITCALGAVFVSSGMMAATPTTLAAILIMLAAIYLTFRASVEKVSQKS